MDEEDSLEVDSVIEHYQAKLKASSNDAFEDLKEHVTISSGDLTLDLLKKRCSPQQTISFIYQFFESADLPLSSAEHFIQLLGTEGKIPTRCLTNKHLTSTLPVKDSKAESTCQQSKAFKKSSTVVSGSISKLTPSTQSSSRSQPSHNAASTSVIIPAQKAPVVSAFLPESLDITSGDRDSIVELAKQEAHVIQRIAELRKNGMWSIRRLPKVAEPSRVKAHWDYLLEEMSWLAADFMQERKWKRNSAKQCSKMITKYHSLKGGQAQRIEKEEQIKLRRIASNIAKMVKTFWSEIEKLVEHKQEVQLKEKRKKIHDMQLRFIVDKVDHFTEKLTQEFVTPSLKNSRAPSVDSDQMLIDELEVPQARKNNRINELKRKELELSKDPDENEAELEKGSSCSDDDEETIAKEEDQETKETMDPKVELNELESEANIPIEELLSRYGYDSEMANSEQTNYTTAEEETDSEETSNENENIDITYSVNDVDNTDSRREMTEADAVAAAESIQPKGNTLSSVEVITKVPFLLKHQLREYQHIGLHWLASLYEKHLNGILADEKGLGKTVQTISLIAHLACEKGIWGPHLIVVPTSVMLNWEMEIKKWCPSLKVLTYYGNAKERRMKRKGWTGRNAFHVCITSYKLVVQDHSSFRRKKWVYFILDEAQHIKNFKSQRWQMLLKINSARRLLLTGGASPPLPTDAAGLTSLVDFLLPNVVFQSHAAEDNCPEIEHKVVERLHKALRPFFLRRLKCDVEKQLPKKYEHIVQCSLSKRQRQLYDRYMGEGETKATLASGSFLGVISTLMQLRKVCNHPNLFDSPRPTISPFVDQEIVYRVSSLVSSVLDYQPLSQIDLSTLNLLFSQLSTELTTLDHRTIECFQLDPAQMENCLKSEPQSTVYARLSSFEGFNCWLRKSLKPNLQTSNRSIFQTSSFSKDINQDTSNCDIEMELETDGSSMIQSSTEGTLGIGKHAKKEINARVEQLRKDKLRKMMVVNKRKCFASPLYSKDCINAVNLRNETSVFISHCDGGQSSSLFSHGNGCSRCLLTQTSSLNPDESSNALREMLHTPSSLESSLRPILERYLCIVPSVLASPLKLTITHLPSYKKIVECNFAEGLTRKLPTDFFDVTVVPRIQLRFQLSEIRLIQYDCGKLQTLDRLLWKLKAGNHRVLIFTQMSRMLDIFEQFLSYHGHTYLRLDGATKIEQRQALMERFNADQRIFCFILSTRSGGVGVNLTGADTVIFYDSDWNPTMDAQAQDRCHRIAQTRDVHIYRLVSERTVEENILRKAQQKKLLGDLAIEEGNFTTAFFKQAAIQELFEIDQSNEPTEVISNPPVSTQQSSSADLISEMGNAVPVNYRNAFEQALGTAEEEPDVAAAKEVRAEAAAELIEFDETVPIEDASEEKSPEEEQIEQAISQLLPIGRFALQYVEEQQQEFQHEHDKEEEEESKKQVQKSIKEWRQSHDEELRQAQAELKDSMVTCAREDASLEKLYIADNSTEPMPVWAPPTPPADENDHYVDHSLGFLYESTLMPESQLPPIYVPKDHHKRLRVEVPPLHARKQAATAAGGGGSQSGTGAHVQQPATAGGTAAGGGALSTKGAYKKISDDFFQNMKSIFYRPNTTLIRLRKDQLAMKVKLWPGGADLISTFQRCLNSQNSQSFNFQQNVSPAEKASAKTTTQLSLLPSHRWLLREDYAIIMSLLYLQELPCNLSVIYPGHTPNWDFVAEQVNTYNTFSRTDLACRHRYETIISPKNDSIADSHEAKQSAVHSHLLNAKAPKSTKKSAKNQSAAAVNQQQQQGAAGLYLSYPAMSSQSITLNPSGKGASVADSQPPGTSGPGGPKAPPGSAMASGSAATHSMAMNRVAKHLQNVIAEHKNEFATEMHKRFDAIKHIVISKTQTSKSRFHMPPNRKGYDHVTQLATAFNINYNQPKSAEELAAARMERINKEHQAKQKLALANKEQMQQQLGKAPQGSPGVMVMGGGGHPQQQYHAQQPGSASPSTPMMMVPGSPAHQQQQQHQQHQQFQQLQQQQQQLQTAQKVHLLNPATIQLLQQQQQQQQQQQSTGQTTVSVNSLPQGLVMTTTQKGGGHPHHQIINSVGGPSTLVNRGPATVVSAVGPAAATNIVPVQLQQVVGNAANAVTIATSSAGQQNQQQQLPPQTFAISVLPGQIAALQQQHGQQVGGGPIQFAPTSLTGAMQTQQQQQMVVATSGGNLQQQQQQQVQASSALVAALSQQSAGAPSRLPSEGGASSTTFQNVTTSTGNLPTLRTLTSLSGGNNTNSPILLMQPAQQQQQPPNVNIITQSIASSSSPSVSLLTTSTTADSSPMNAQAPGGANKMVNFSQTGGTNSSTLSSILNTQVVSAGAPANQRMQNVNPGQGGKQQYTTNIIRQQFRPTSQQQQQQQQQSQQQAVRPQQATTAAAIRSLTAVQGRQFMQTFAGQQGSGSNPPQRVQIKLFPHGGQQQPGQQSGQQVTVSAAPGGGITASGLQKGHIIISGGPQMGGGQGMPTPVSLINADNSVVVSSSPMNPATAATGGKIATFTQATTGSPALSSILNTQGNVLSAAASGQAASATGSVQGNRMQGNQQIGKFLIRQQTRPQQQQQQLQQQHPQTAAAIRANQLVGVAQGGRPFQMQNIRQANSNQRLQIKVFNSVQQQQQGGGGQQTMANAQGSANQKGHIIISSNQLVGAGQAGVASSSASASSATVAAHIPSSVLQQVQIAMTSNSSSSSSPSGHHLTPLTIKTATVSGAGSSANSNQQQQQQHSSALVAALSSQSTPPRAADASSSSSSSSFAHNTTASSTLRPLSVAAVGAPGSSSNPIMLLATTTTATPTQHGQQQQQHTSSALVAALSSQSTTTSTPSRSSEFANITTSNSASSSTPLRPLAASTNSSATPIVLLQAQPSAGSQTGTSSSSSSTLRPGAQSSSGSTPMDTSQD